LAIQATIEQLFAAYRALPQFAAIYASQDCSLAEHLRGLGFDRPALAVADVLLAQTCCAPLEQLSCADLIREMQVDHAGYDEFHIRQGYSALLAWYSRDLPIRLNSAVQRVQWQKSGVIVHTAQEVLQTQRCIITLPVSLLQAGTIRFDPPLSAAKQQAIHALRMEPATKLIYRFREPLWDDALVFMAHAGVAARWWTPGYGRPNAAVLAAFVTAERARQIDALPEAAALALGLQELSQLLDNPQLLQQCVGARRVAWAADSYARGGYASVPPGAASARLHLAEPEGTVLFFAGEATAYESNPQTVHGAIESGWRAARECLG
jgi:monoamine oxidase